MTKSVPSSIASFEALDPTNPNYLDSFIHLVRTILFNKITYVNNSDNSIGRDKFFSLLKSCLEEVRDNNQVIIFIGEGHSSLAFKIDNFVIKINKLSSIYEENRSRPSGLIPTFKYTSIKISEREYYAFQFNPYVDTTNISEEDIYTAYKRLRNEGYIWNDPKKENVGRIVRNFEFEGHFYNQGDIVIFDTEDIAYVGENTTDEIMDEIETKSYNPLVYKFEMKYIEESGPKGYS